MPSLRQVLDRYQHLLDGFRVERGGDLVEQHHVGVHRQRTRDRDALLLAAGEFARVGVFLAVQTHLV